MSTAADTRFKRELENERSVAPFIPYKAHATRTTLVTGDGDLLRIWKVEGLSFATAELEDLERRKDELNTLLRGIGSTRVAIWSHQVRRRVKDRLRASFSNPFAREIDDDYYRGLEAEEKIVDDSPDSSSTPQPAPSKQTMMANELYYTLVYRPAPTRLDRISRKASKRSVAEILDDQRASIAKMDDLAREFEAGLRRYNATALAAYEDGAGAQCSEVLEFLNFLLTGEWQKVRIPRGPLDTYLGNAYVFVGNETLLLRSGTKDRYAQLIDFKDYPEHTEPGILNKVMMETTEYVITQSFSFLGKMDGKKFLEKQRNQMRASEDGSGSQMMQLDTAIDQIVSGHFLLGEYHFSMMVFGETPNALADSTAKMLNIYKEQGFLPVKIATALDAAFYAQLPCNWQYRPRIAQLTSLNFAGLSPLHNFPHGKRDGNPWGQAVTLLKTPSQQPFYFNFHASKDDEDSFDKKVLANTRVIGASGTGKTVLLNFLEAQLLKYSVNSPTGYGSVFLDKDRGAELAIRAMGGKYLALKDGVPTGFNPFQLEPNGKNMLFLEQWVASLVSKDGQLTAGEEQQITHAIRTVMLLPRSLRRLGTLVQNLPEGDTASERENSLSRRLQKWVGNGPYAWVADNAIDILDFTSGSLFGFDGTAFLDNKVVCGPISSYLLHRMEDLIDGRRFKYTMDECWKWVDDKIPAFQEFAGNKQLTIRKQNGFGIFATQMPSSVLNSKIGSALVQQCATEVYLPNPKADRDEYIQGFKLTAAEFEMVASMPDDCRMFMVKQGHRSTFAKLDLGHMGDHLAILSGSTDNTELLDDVLGEVGEDPVIWMPVFHRRRKERTNAGRLAATH
ncbi:VirB4 family type IV secretion/conjugal transfer ATPase [Xanthomonas citri]|uniref:VirB4 family type IV secretion/conjugal transfer ATPase n=1 Tax=Xanthomonas citri TaxID=346 RepID=UPI000C53220A|nr:VirB4 family type IV secretion/conjugal transfer ATPase [Xanthomonas citri]SOO14159.1 Type IV secretion system protein virB4 [Xanthomonas citri pv. fuscans]